jgi:hypothetical protein
VVGDAEAAAAKEQLAVITLDTKPPCLIVWPSQSMFLFIVNKRSCIVLVNTFGSCYVEK